MDYCFIYCFLVENTKICQPTHQAIIQTHEPFQQIEMEDWS